MSGYGGRIDVGSNAGLFFVDGEQRKTGVYLIAVGCGKDFRKNVMEKRCGWKFASAKEVWLVGFKILFSTIELYSRFLF